MSGPTSVEQIINQALDRAGFPEYIGNIYEGTKQARVALNIYGQTRDELLRSSDWDFAEKIAAAALSGQTAPNPWSVEYTYPADCIRLRNMFNAAYLADKNNPLSVLYTVATDPVAGKVILCNTTGATLIYTSRVVDMAKWEPLFVEGLVTALGRRLAPALANMQVAEAMAGDEKMTVTKAEGITG